MLVVGTRVDDTYDDAGAVVAERPYVIGVDLGYAPDYGQVEFALRRRTPVDRFDEAGFGIGCALDEENVGSRCESRDQFRVASQ